MPWRVGFTVSDARRAFLEDYSRGVPLSLLLAAYEIKKSAAYDLLKRARETSVDEAVAVRSRAPRRRPTKLSKGVARRVVAMKKAFPQWGPKKLRVAYAKRFKTQPPSATSMNSILKARGLTRVNRRLLPRVVQLPLTEPLLPNDVWAADHKGKMSKLGVEPLTVIDLYTRYWLTCRPFTDKSQEDTRAAFEALFDAFGLPLVIRVDPGQPWTAVRAAKRLSKLSAWWVALGLRVEVAWSPQRNGCVERLHGTMERDMNESCRDIRRHFDRHRREYNEDRPHEALGMATPSSLYRPSRRRPLERPFDPISLGYDESRKVQKDGTISWRRGYPHICAALAGRSVGLRRRTATLWSLHYYELELGHLNADHFTPIYD